MTALLRLLSGILLLVFGRSLFWLFVAVVGFLAGASLATRVLHGRPEWVMLAVALAVGLVGALLALALPRVVGAVAGFVAGGYVVVTLLEIVDLSLGGLTWLPVLIGGIVGAAIVLIMFDWALIGLSSLAGAAEIARVLVPRGGLALLVIAVLFVVGVIFQTGLWPRALRRPV
ncbi:MAG: hypothetical protein M1132_05425 [Chloroflexi bacterium]|nr:hypothetical protein [Chloroflexota bacterium]